MYRKINIEKRERLLAGRSVWYSNAVDIERDLKRAFKKLHSKKRDSFFRDEFVRALVECFPLIWRVHPFREGNTRTVVMLMTLLAEHHGYYMDQELMAASAGYVRDSFVMTSLDQASECEHLERILMDAVCEEPIQYDDSEASGASEENRSGKYRKYQKEPYVPEPHYRRDDD